MSWRSGNQSLTAVSSCEAELVGTVTGIQHGINLVLGKGESSHHVLIAQTLNDNSAALEMV
eukprot:12902252-Prorocentrum_lima.AAC.1